MRARGRRDWIIGAGLVALILFGPGIVHVTRLSVEQRRLDRRLAELARERERLAAERERLESDPAYVEGLIRGTFKVAKPGEVVIPLDSGQGESYNGSTTSLRGGAAR